MKAPYRPNPSVLKALSSVDFVAVIGPSAAGKTTLIERALEQNENLHLVRVTTSRAPRPDERDGIDYHFRSQQEMQEQLAAGTFVQVAPTVFDDLYATSPSEYSPSGVAVMAVIADAMPTFLSLPFKRVRQIFILPPNWEVWHARISERHFTHEQLTKRMKEAHASLLYALSTHDISFIVNDSLDQASDDFYRFTLGAYASDPHGGKTLARKLLERLERSEFL